MAISGGIAAAAVVAGGSMYSANKSAKSQSKAMRNAQAQQRMLIEEANRKLDPYAQAGQQALSPLTSLITGNEQQQLNSLQNSPGYQFRISEAQKMIQNSQAARGNLLSGGALKELSQYGQGLASEEYGNRVNQLQGLANMGQDAATAQAGIYNQNIPGQTNLSLGGDPAMVDSMQSQNMSNAFSNMMPIIGSLQGGNSTTSGGMGSFGGSKTASNRNSRSSYGGFEPRSRYATDLYE